MIRFALFALLISFIAPTYGQLGYTDYVKTDGVQISTKWGKAKDESGNRQTALLIGVVNENTHPIAYSFEILLYYEGILRERALIENQCLDAQRSSIGKLNGVYFIPENFTDEQLKNKDFNFTLESIDVEEIESCD